MNLTRTQRWAGRATATVLLLGALGGSGRAAPANAAPAQHAATLSPLTLDSLETGDFSYAFIAAPDAQTLAALRREMEYAANQFRRSIGPYPPKISVAALGSLSDPSRVNPAALHVAGIDYVLMDWPQRAGPSRPAASGAPAAGRALPTAADAAPIPSLAERASRWYLLAYERKNGRGTPLPGKTRLVPDWLESGLAGLAALPAEQNRRGAWMRQRIDQHIPMGKFLEMARPVAGQAAGPGAGGKQRPRTQPGAAAGTGALAPGMDPTQLFDAQALSFARFLAEREDERFIGLALEILLTGQPQIAAFNIAKTVLPRPDMLEKEWVAWVNESAPPSGAR